MRAAAASTPDYQAVVRERRPPRAVEVEIFWTKDGDLVLATGVERCIAVC